MSQLEHIRKKSKENGASAELLITKGCYAASIHCSYYQMLQHAMNFLYQKGGKTISDLIAEEKAARRLRSLEESKKRGPGHHEMTRLKLVEYFQTHRNPESKSEMISKFNSLQKLREVADYYNESITKDQAQISQETSLALINILK